MKRTQPTDEWEFLHTDDEPPVQPRRYAELDAMHEVPPVRILDDLPLVAMEADVAAAGPRRYFDDEQPEEPAPPRAAEETELTLEELLESQHYAFEPARPDAAGAP